MSIQSDIRGIFRLTPEQKRAIRKEIVRLKHERALVKKAVERLIKDRADAKTGRLISQKDRATYARLQDKYGQFNNKIFRLGGNKKALPYEEFS